MRSKKTSQKLGLIDSHTYVTKFVRALCADQGVSTGKDKALHSLLGEYIKKLRDGRHIEFEMTLRILKSTISTLEAFNDVRNNRSLAHDNTLLNYDEALLILNHVASSIRFLRALNNRIERGKKTITEHQGFSTSTSM